MLRVKLGYDGVAIAYGLETEAVRGTLSLEEAAVQAVSAGCDMLLVARAASRRACPGSLERRSAVRETSQALALEQALKRIQHAKRGLRPTVDKLPRGSLENLIKQFTAFSAAFAGSENRD